MAPPRDVERGPVAAAPAPNTIISQPVEWSAVDHRSPGLRQGAARALAGITIDPGAALFLAAGITWMVGR